jgi:gliding motility-associated-like protein
VKKWIIHILLLFLVSAIRGQQCPDLLQPTNNQTNVPVTTTISWEAVSGINGYIISLGTSPGGTDIVNEQQVGLETTFVPPLGLPELTDIYVTISLFFINQDPIVCPSQRFTTENVTTIPECTVLESPVNGEENVSTGTSIRWFYAARAIGYRLTLGTAPGLGDILNDGDLGNTLLYVPPNDFPPDTTIYVRITPYNENGGVLNCLEEQFTTSGGGEPPVCTMLTDPLDGETNVPLSTTLSWAPAPNAIGYIVYIGSSPIENNVLDGAVFNTTSISVINFEPNRTYFVRIVPFNEAGEAQGCKQESFSTILGCGPFLDPDTGQLVNLAPEISFPEVVGLCEGNIPTTITTPDQADGFRWFKIPPQGGEIQIGEGPSVAIEEEGNYRYEAYNRLSQNGFDIECTTSSRFEVFLSSAPQITQLIREPLESTFNVTALIQGTGSYEYALNNIEGPYQPENVFLNLPPGSYTLFVRDLNGCGLAQRDFKLAFPPPGFPSYFSPNSDGINDYWQYLPPKTDALNLKLIEVYDRFGKILERFSPFALGWDGSYRGIPMPAGGYWYRALAADGQVYRGYFSLVR